MLEPDRDRWLFLLRAELTLSVSLMNLVDWVRDCFLLNFETKRVFFPPAIGVPQCEKQWVLLARSRDFFFSATTDVNWLGAVRLV